MRLTLDLFLSAARWWSGPKGKQICTLNLNLNLILTLNLNININIHITLT